MYPYFGQPKPVPYMPKCTDPDCVKDRSCSITHCNEVLCRHNIETVTHAQSTFDRCPAHKVISHSVAKKILLGTPSGKRGEITERGFEYIWGKRTFFVFKVRYLGKHIQEFAVFTDTGEVVSPKPNDKSVKRLNPD